MEALEPPIVPADDLDWLELQIARRADELCLQAGIRGKDLEHWLQAEREIMERCR
jgi:hypothetical protein